MEGHAPSWPRRLYGRDPAAAGRPSGLVAALCRLGNAAGFSLVEVALAVAVIAIGLLAILGLFPQGLQSARNAADNTLVATIAQDLFSQLRSGNFNSIRICTDPNCTTWVQLDLRANNAGTLNFDHDSFITNALASYYQVVLRCQPQSQLALSLVQATVVWPAHVSSAPINTNIFMTEIARYDNP